MELTQNVLGLIKSYPSYKELSTDSGIEVDLIKNVQKSLEHSSIMDDQEINKYSLSDYMNAVDQLCKMSSHRPTKQVSSMVDWSNSIIKKDYTVRIRHSNKGWKYTSIVANDGKNGAMTSVEKTFNAPVATVNQILNTYYVPHFYNPMDIG